MGHSFGKSLSSRFPIGRALAMMACALSVASSLEAAPAPPAACAGSCATELASNPKAVPNKSGAIANSGVLVVTSPTFTANEHSSGYDGSAIASSGTLTIHNTIIAENGGNQCVGVSGGGDSLVFPDDGTCSGFTAGDPKLGPLQVNPPGTTATHALLPGSAALDAGSLAFCPARDQRGVLRPQGPGCDIGAYEAPGS